MYKSNLFNQLCALIGRVIFDVPINKINYLHAHVAYETRNFAVIIYYMIYIAS